MRTFTSRELRRLQLAVAAMRGNRALREALTSAAQDPEAARRAAFERTKERRMREGWSAWGAREVAPCYEESQHPWGNPDLADRKSKAKRRRARKVDTIGRMIDAACRYAKERTG